MKVLCPQMTAMELLPLTCLCLLTCSATTSADGNGPAVKVIVKEDGDAILPCSLSSGEDIQSKLFDWKKDDRKEVFMYDNDRYGEHHAGQDAQFKGRVSHFPDELKNGNASIKITKTNAADSGKYTCIFPRLQPERKFHIELVIEPILKDRSKENIKGASPKPSVKILDQTKDWALLQCVVEGASPKPELQWRDSSGNILPAEDPQVSERGGRYDVTLQTTVTKTDNYSCVATQETINHQTHAETYVHINGAASKPSVTILDQTEDWSLLQCVVEGASPKPELQWRDSSGNILPAEDPQVSERGGSYDIILQTTVTKTDNYRCVATQETINHQTHAETYVRINEETSSKLTIGVVGVLVGIIGTLVVGGIVFGLLKARSGGSNAAINHSNEDSSRDQRHQTAGNGFDSQINQPLNTPLNATV